MNKLELQYDGRTLALTADGKATATDGAGQTASGTWTSESKKEEQNRISISITGLGTVLLDVDYSFNVSNQLVLTVPKQDKVPAASAAEPFAGWIIADDPQDLVYVCIDEKGEATDCRIHVYGIFRFDKTTDRLYFDPTGEEDEVEIVGDEKDENNVITGISTAPGQTTLDLLKFSATTINKFGAKTYRRLAVIEFVGNWDLYDGKLVFVARYLDEAGTKPKTYIAFAGSVKGVNTSLVYSGPDGTVLFTIASKFQINRTTGNWEASFGYANKTLTAALTLNTKTQIGDNGQLDLNGTLKLKQASGKKVEIDLKLEAKYEAAGKNITCTIEYDGRTVELHLEGSVKIGALGDVEFDVKYAPGNPEEKLKLKLGNLKSNAKLKTSLEVILGRKNVKLGLNATYRIRWEGGVQVPA